jgi:hypothetical protein
MDNKSASFRNRAASLIFNSIAMEFSEVVGEFVVGAFVLEVAENNKGCCRALFIITSNFSRTFCSEFSIFLILGCESMGSTKFVCSMDSMDSMDAIGFLCSMGFVGDQLQIFELHHAHGLCECENYSQQPIREILSLIAQPYFDAIQLHPA